MGTSRGPGCVNTTVDLGAQYISATPENFKAHQRLYGDLLQAGVLQPLAATIEGDRSHPEGTRHFIPPQGSGSLVKYFLNKSDAVLKYNHTVTTISQRDTRWNVSTESGEAGLFDCVVLTMPVPQILQLQGTIQDIIDSKRDVKESLSNVSYSSRFAVGLFYQPGTQIDIPWSAKYFDDPCVRFVSIDTKKRGINSAEVGPSVCVHTSVPFSLLHLAEDKETVGAQHVLPRVRELLPQLPEPAAVKNHKWKFSQVYQGYQGHPEAITLSDQPLLLCGGDAFTSSGFDNCVDSALKITSLIQEHC